MHSPPNSNVIVKKSKIHETGVFANKDLPKGTRIIQYLGEKITKEEGNKREQQHLQNGKVWLFELNDKYDLDGDVPENDAKYINHSCDPNCDPLVKGDEVWIIAIKDIKKGEELTFDYGFDFEYWYQHPCKCGAQNCAEYIVGEEHRPKLKEILSKRLNTLTVGK